MPIKRLTGDFAQTTVGGNPGVANDTVISLTADTTAGSPILINASTTAGLIAGQTLTGTGIDPYTTIKEIAGDVILLSQPATADATTVALSVAGATQVIGLTDWSIAVKTKSVDATTTDDDCWEDSLPSSNSWTAKASYVYLMGDPSQATYLRSVLGSGQRAISQWNFFLDSTSGDDSITGRAYITGLTIAAGVGKTITMEVSLKGVSSLSVRNQATYEASLIFPTGTIRVFESGTLGNGNYASRWENFTLTSVLPPDAVITGIYPVIVASCSNEVGYTYFEYGPSLSMSTPGGSTLSSPFDPTSSNFSSTEFYGGSIGTNLSDLIGQQIGVLENISLLLTGLDEEIDITAVAFAVYYDSILPSTDPLIPPPFAVPSGLAWALPATSTQTGMGFMPRGYALATPAIAEV